MELSPDLSILPCLPSSLMHKQMKIDEKIAKMEAAAEADQEEHQAKVPGTWILICTAQCMKCTALYCHTMWCHNSARLPPYFLSLSHPPFPPLPLSPPSRSPCHLPAPHSFFFIFLIQRPAIQKLKFLAEVEEFLAQKKYHEMFISAGGLGVLKVTPYERGVGGGGRMVPLPSFPPSPFLT